MAVAAVLVGVGELERAAALLAAGSPVVVAARDADAVGRLVARLRTAGGRAAGYVGDADDEAAGEMARELFPDPPGA